MKKPLNVLFYGMTHEHAGGKFDTLKKMPWDYQIAAFVDDTARPTPRYANISGKVKECGLTVVGEADAWQVPDIDVVFVETANGDLMEIAKESAGRGLPMHCDKPCGETFAPYKEVVEICRAKNLPFQIGYMFRGNPAVQFCWKAVREGWLGDLTFVEADMNHCYGDDAYQTYVGKFSGGILYNLGCHLIDMILPMIPGELRRATPMIADAAGDPSGCRNRTASLLEFDGCAVLIRACSRTPDGINRRYLRIDGTQGAIDLAPIERFDGQNLRLTLTLARPAGGYDAGRHIIDFGAMRDRYMAQLSQLAQTIRGERPNPDSYDHDLRVHEITLKACGML